MCFRLARTVEEKIFPLPAVQLESITKVGPSHEERSLSLLDNLKKGEVFRKDDLRSRRNHSMHHHMSCMQLFSAESHQLSPLTPSLLCPSLRQSAVRCRETYILPIYGSHHGSFFNVCEKTPLTVLLKKDMIRYKFMS